MASNDGSPPTGEVGNVCLAAVRGRGPLSGLVPMTVSDPRPTLHASRDQVDQGLLDALQDCQRTDHGMFSRADL